MSNYNRNFGSGGGNKSGQQQIKNGANDENQIRFDFLTKEIMSKWLCKDPEPDAENIGKNVYISTGIRKMGPKLQLCKYLGPYCRMIKVHEPKKKESESSNNNNKTASNPQPGSGDSGNQKVSDSKFANERTISFWLPSGPDQELAINALLMLNEWGGEQVKKNWLGAWKMPVLKRLPAEKKALIEKGINPDEINDDDIVNMNQPRENIWSGCILTRDQKDDSKWAPMCRARGRFPTLEKVENSKFETLEVKTDEDGNKWVEKEKIQPSEFLRLISQPQTEFVPIVQYPKLYLKAGLWQWSSLLVAGYVVPPKEEEIAPFMSPDELSQISGIRDKKRPAPSVTGSEPDPKKNRVSAETIDGTDPSLVKEINLPDPTFQTSQTINKQ